MYSWPVTFRIYSRTIFFFLARSSPAIASRCERSGRIQPVLCASFYRTLDREGRQPTVGVTDCSRCRAACIRSGYNDIPVRQVPADIIVIIKNNIMLLHWIPSGHRTYQEKLLYIVVYNARTIVRKVCASLTDNARTVLWKKRAAAAALTSFMPWRNDAARGQRWSWGIPSFPSWLLSYKSHDGNKSL